MLCQMIKGFSKQADVAVCVCVWRGRRCMSLMNIPGIFYSWIGSCAFPLITPLDTSWYIMMPNRDSPRIGCRRTNHRIFWSDTFFGSLVVELTFRVFWDRFVYRDNRNVVGQLRFPLALCFYYSRTNRWMRAWAADIHYADPCADTSSSYY